MTVESGSSDWVYVYVTTSANEETFLGLYNKENDVNFIPAFQTKDDANECFLSIPREKGKKYEVQAVHIEELHQEAAKSGFVVAMVDNEGNIVK